jgi:aspartate/methionine/tyrosine aminotransferase
VDIETFAVEKWMSGHEMTARWNIAETCVDSLTLGELVELGGNGAAVLDDLRRQKLTYGHIYGRPRLREFIAGTYAHGDPERVVTTPGAIGANFLALYTLVRPGDRVVCVTPTYQQLLSVPASFGAEVRPLQLRPENGFVPDLDELATLVDRRTSLIVLNNPNNPTGALIDAGLLEQVMAVAARHGAWVLADEVYRGLEHEEGIATPSVVDLYERAVSTGSMSKVYSLAGLRLGWVSGPAEFVAACADRRDHTTISCGLIDEILATLALEHGAALLERNLDIVRANARRLDEWVAAEPRLDYVPPRAGTTAFVHFDYEIGSADLAQRLFDRDGTFIVPGSGFGMERWQRVSFACAPAVLEGGLAGVSACLRELEAAGLGR